MEKQNTYIYSIEGKDILLSNNNYHIDKNKKFNASINYSLDTIKLEEVAKDILNKNIFYIEDDKQCCKEIVNLNFTYSVNEYNAVNIGKRQVFLFYDYKGKIEDLKFVNGFAVMDKKIVAIEPNNKSIPIVKNEFMDLLQDELIELPKGFFTEIKDNKISIFVRKNEIKTVINCKGIRERIYRDNFKINNRFFVRYKRSSGSSRKGSCLFTLKKLYKPMMDWSYMGLNTKGKIDLASMEAYIALTTSGIIDTIKIEPKSILLIEPYESIFENRVMATRIVDNKLSTKVEDNYEVHNDIWDGQSLIDFSVTEGTEYENKGYLLLRNRFFKSACFQANIQQFFKDNNITDISELNGKTLAKNVSDIKMITTKDSIKYLKFNKSAHGFDDYINQLEDTWGIVKYDKPTHYFDGDMVQTHYQLINTLQLSKQEIFKLLKPSLDYLKLLKRDIKVFRYHCHSKPLNDRDMDIEDIENMDVANNNDLMMRLLEINNKFENTDLFVSFRQDVVDSFIKNLNRGHILINGTYAVLCGNGYEMLQDSIGKFNRENPEPILKKDEIYCSFFKDEEKLLGCRSPHCTMGNLLLCKNATKKSVEKTIDKYFKKSLYIIHINSIKNNIMERLSGADFDSDQILVTNNSLLINSCEKNYDKFLVPTNATKEEKTNNNNLKLRENTPTEKADLDYNTSQNLIGNIINTSQILNSLFWNKLVIYSFLGVQTQDINTKNIFKNKLDNLYAAICTLDVLSGIEIDKAKKEFPIDSKKELDNIINKYCKKLYFLKKENKLLPILNGSPHFAEHNPKAIVKEGFKPNFFKTIADKKCKNLSTVPFATSFEYLQDVIKEQTENIKMKRRNSKGVNSIATLSSLFKKNVILDNADGKQIQKIINECQQIKKSINFKWDNKQINGTEKYKQTEKIRQDFIKRLSKLKISSASIRKILSDLDKEYEKRREYKKRNEKYSSDLIEIGRLLITCLFKSHKKEFLFIFNESKEKIEYIERKKYNDNNSLETIKLYDIEYVVKTP